MLRKFNQSTGKFEGCDVQYQRHSPFGPLKAYRIGGEVYVECSFDAFGALATRIDEDAIELIESMGIQVKPKLNSNLRMKNKQAEPEPKLKLEPKPDTTKDKAR